jgi:hypothetical protein
MLSLPTLLIEELEDSGRDMMEGMKLYLGCVMMQLLQF